LYGAAYVTLVFRNVHPRYYSGEPIQGFLYYHVPYPSQFLSVSLRFRCTPYRNPDNFHAGSDLSDRYGLAWNISLPRMVSRPRFTAVLDHLISQDKLLTEEQLRTAKN
ncbi:hypothetical protein DFH08DRAFT_866543, partial [Mycena albidolilacea]